jgi:isochorismate pyruvate lyase
MFTTLEQVRTEIDRIDHEIVKLVGERLVCVKQASSFKTSERDVAAPERLAAMLQARREWAIATGLSADMIEKLFRNMVSYFIATETEEWRSRQPTI